MSTKSKVLENSFFYTFSSLLMNAFAFLLLPIYTMFLTPKDYGITNLINSFTNVAIFIVAFSLYSSVIRFYTDFKNDIDKLKQFYGTVITFIFISGLIFLILGLLFHNIFVSYFFMNISFFPIVLMAMITIPFVSLHVIHQNILQGRQQGKKLTIINLVVFGIQVCLNLFFIGVLKFGAIGVLLATLVTNVGYSIYMLIDLIKTNLIVFCLDIKILKEALKYSIPIMPHNLSTSIATFASRVFINNRGSLESVGLFSVASQFGTIVDVVQSSVNQAFAPWFYDMMNNKSEDTYREIVKLSHLLIIFYSLLYMVIGLFSQEVIILMTNKRYIMSWTVIPILVVAFSVKSIYYFYINILFYYKDAAKKIFIATVIGSFSDVIIAFFLVPLFGMYGAAISFLIAKIIVVSIVVLMSRKYNNIGYKITSMVKTIVPSLLFMGSGLYFSYTKYLIVFSWLNLLYKFGVLGVYLIFIYFTNKKIINKFIKTRKLSKYCLGNDL
jgi:O-antigen/teichoic acid export membrane protein